MRTLFGMVIFVALLLTGSLAAAEVYQWEDDQGGLHFTDNADKIPAKYRHKVQQRESIRGDDAAVKSAPAQEAGQAEATPLPAKGVDGGPSISRWTDRLNAAKQELVAAQGD